MACPGPFTLAIPLRHAGGPYRDRDTLVADLALIVNRELRALAAAGADFIQVDEPNFVMLRGADARARVELFNRTVEGVPGTLALHVCFGNLHTNAFATPREYRPLLPALRDARCRQLVLEFANREMAEIELMKELPTTSWPSASWTSRPTGWRRPRRSRGGSAGRSSTSRPSGCGSCPTAASGPPRVTPRWGSSGRWWPATRLVRRELAG